MEKKKTNTELEVGQKYIGKLRNEYRGKIITIDDLMLEDHDRLCYFLHYFGFKRHEENEQG